MNRETKKSGGSGRRTSEKGFLWCVLIVLTILITLIINPNLAVQKHAYQPGDVARRDIKAPYDFLVEDKEATEVNRKQAVESVLTVYDHDAALNNNIKKKLRQAFESIRSLIPEPAGEPVEKASAPGDVPLENGEHAESLHDRIWQAKGAFEEKLGIPVSNGAYRILEKENFSKEIEALIASIIDNLLTNGVVANKEILLREQDKGITLRNVETGRETSVTKLKRFYGMDQALTMVRVVGQPLLEGMDYTLTGLIVDFSQRLLSPNITLNASETNERRKRAAKDIKPFLYKIKAGEMILREGERVTDFQLVKLAAMRAQMKDEQIITSRIGTALAIMCMLIVTYVLHLKNQLIIARDRNKNILFLASTMATFVFLTKISVTFSDGLAAGTPFNITASSMYFGIPLAAGAMTVCLFMGMAVAIPFATIMVVCSVFIFNSRIELLIYFLLSSYMAAYWMQHCRERIVFIKAGLKLGLLNLVFVTTLDIYTADLGGFKLLWDWTFAFLGGLITGIVAAGIAPLVESAFGYTTDIKLLELANLDRPILRRLMIEASGTYHHSVIVGTMVEAAASAINANPLLARVCGYYHDIGKINKPLYFIENQTGGKNKHDKLAPSMSSLILISHIKDGVEIAKANKLGKAILDTIRQHHGTSLISYFYDKAKQMRGEENVNVDDFRYPGPKPQTREAGLVMLADVIEAASRTLDNPTPSRIQGLVQNLINKIFSDGQLNNCELTLQDLNNIAKSFIKILDGIYHNRIEYPESPAQLAGKKKNGNSDRQSPKKSDDRPKEDTSQSEGRLKRLGQSRE